MHFDDSVWVSLVRGTIDLATKTEVENHMQTGCTECQEALATWNRIQESTRRDRSCAPPADLVRMVKQEFEIQNPAEEKRTVLATLRFDSFARPAVSGVRTATGAANNSRQVVYESNGLTIDMRFEFQPPKCMVVVGQVIDKNNEYAMPLMLVLFNDHGAAVLESQTTEFGEFQFECDIRERLRLSFELTPSKRVQVPLNEGDNLPK